jgi:hypothetical protein
VLCAGLSRIRFTVAYVCECALGLTDCVHSKDTRWHYVLFTSAEAVGQSLEIFLKETSTKGVKVR